MTVWTRRAAELAVAWRRRARADMSAAEQDRARAVRSGDAHARRAAAVVADHVAAEYRAACARVLALTLAGVSGGAAAAEESPRR